MPTCFAAYSDDDTAMQSSSGGVFPVLADAVLDAGGSVCGAAFDKDWLVAHKIVSDKAGLGAFKTSKYLQSDTKLVFREMKKLLDGGKSVLFSGTPCQVAGLYGFLGKDSDQLLTIDVFCHGVPSPAVWERYLRETTNRGAIVSVNFRDKWAAIRSCAEFNTTIHWVEGPSDSREAGEMAARTFSQHFSDNTYMKGFLQNLYLRKSCASCPFARTPRASDISLGDFWGYDRVDKKCNTSRGISAVLLNSAKGEKFFNDIKDRLQFLRPVPFKPVIRGNPVLKEPSKHHPNRRKFFDDFARLEQEDGVSDLIEKHLGGRDIGIMNFASISDHNFGAVLVGYAMERACYKLGYNPNTIHVIPRNELFMKSGDSVFSDFRKKFLNMTGICTSKVELKDCVNDLFDKFVIGSDQIIRTPWHRDFIYYLDWVGGKKTLCAYAASFGVSELGMNRREKAYAKRCLDRFDAFSVREHSGAKIMQNEFGINSPVVCDPTLLLTADEYQPIIDAYDCLPVEDEYLAYYFLDESREVLANFAEKYPIIDAYRDECGNFRSFGEWLHIIKNAEYVITDSFHGCVFSMIYQRQFIVLTTMERGNDRLGTLMQILGQNRLVADRKNLNESLFADKIDYETVDRNVGEWRTAGYEYLKNALAIAPSEKRAVVKKAGYVFNLLEILPIVKIRPKGYKTLVRLFGFIPFLKIKHGKVYLFEFLKVGTIKG